MLKKLGFILSIYLQSRNEDPVKHLWLSFFANLSAFNNFCQKLRSRYLAGSQMRVCFLFMNSKWKYEYSSPCILHWHYIRKYNDFIKFFLYVSMYPSICIHSKLFIHDSPPWIVLIEGPTKTFTVWKVFKYFFLVRIFPYSDWIRRFTL